jgi:hypothetical protein
MGRVTTPTYRLEYAGRTRAVRNWYFTPAVWHARKSTNVASDGRPTDANLYRWVRAFERSTYPGEPNAHLGITTVTRACIIRQSSGRVVARYESQASYFDAADNDPDAHADADMVAREQESNYQRDTK